MRMCKKYKEIWKFGDLRCEKRFTFMSESLLFGEVKVEFYFIKQFFQKYEIHFRSQ